MIKTKSGRIFELDALRGIAAMCIVLFHFSGGLNAKYFVILQTGVELFFMISGFVILMSLEKVKNSREFIISRLTRLYPTYWACVTITALLILVSKYGPHGGHLLIQYFANMTMFQSWLSQANLDDPYWTLIIEMIFYMLMLSIYALGGLRKIEPIGIVLIILSLLYGRYLSFRFVDLNDLVFQYIGLVYFFPLFFSGIIYYKLKFDKKKLYRYGILLISFVAQLSLFRKLEWRTANMSLLQYTIMLAIYNILFLLYVHNVLQIIVNRVTVFLGFIS
ncbi:MAG TPA: acyltransferase, partial [Mucilaginibacter sp.]